MTATGRKLNADSRAQEAHPGFSRGGGGERKFAHM